MGEVIEPIRDQIGRALYEEPGHDLDWYALSEERREPWRLDADRVIPIAQEHFSAFNALLRAHTVQEITEQHRAVASVIYNFKRHLGPIGMIEAALTMHSKIMNYEIAGLSDALRDAERVRDEWCDEYVKARDT
jgi:hypothetical protein